MKELILENICFISFFLVRYYCGIKWGKASHSKGFWDFIRKEFLMILFVIVVLLQNFQIGLFFQITKPIFLINVAMSIIGVAICFEVRRTRSKNWGRFGTCSKGVLVTWGPNSFSRHPYYLGVLIWGWSISVMYGNLILISLCMIWSILAVVMAKREENFLAKEFGVKWCEYKKRTPFLFGIRSLLP